MQQYLSVYLQGDKQEVRGHTETAYWHPEPYPKLPFPEEPLSGCLGLQGCLLLLIIQHINETCFLSP